MKLHFHVRSYKIIFLCLAVTVFGQSEDLETKPFNSQYRIIDAVRLNDSTSLDAYLKTQREQQHLPALATCIVKDNKIIWQGYYGHADLQKNPGVNDSTAFLLASISKTFTGTAVMQLWERGLFDLDDDVNSYLPADIRVINPWYPEAPITFRMLLTHTSSINYGIFYTRMTWGKDSPITLESFVRNYFTQGGSYYDSTNYTEYCPGSRYLYSNESIALAGYLVEALIDTGFAEYCNEKIFKPLKMTNTSWFLSGLDSTNLAIPYSYLNEIYYPYGYYSLPPYPSTLLKSCASDLARYLMIFINKGEFEGNRILNASTVHLMNTVQYPQIAPFTGLIWIQDYQGTSPVWFHNGSLYGCSTRISYYPVEKIGIVILTNLDHWLVNLEPVYSALYQFAANYITDSNHSKRSKITAFVLNQNYPNPFNTSTTIKFTLSEPTYTELKIHNILGKEVAILVSQKLNAGTHSFYFENIDLASGVYYYQLVAGDPSTGLSRAESGGSGQRFREVKKMILLK